MSKLDILPAKSRQKYLSEVHAKDAAYAALKAANGILSDAITELDRVQADAAYHLENYPKGKLTLDERQRLEAPISRARDAFEIARQAAGRAQSKYREFDYLHSVNEWLDRAPQFGVTLKHQEIAKAPSGEPLEVLARIRSELVALADERMSIDQATVPLEDLKAALSDEIRRLALAGAPRVETRARGVSPINFAAALTPHASPDGRANADNSALTLIWLLQDQLIASASVLLEGRNLQGALTDAERDAALDKISERRTELERLEEAIICTSATRGQVIPRRRDIDARIFLEVREI